MKPTDIATPAEWQNIQSLFSAITGLTSVTFDIDGNPVSPADFQNEFCRVFKSSPEGAKLCRESHMNIAQEAMVTKKPLIGRCKAGLIKVVVPIFYNGEIIGFTGGCGVYHKDFGLDIVSLIEAGALAGIEAEKVRELAETIRGIDKETIDEEIKILQTKVEAIVKRHQI
ncbi:MAG: PocR ligand-binding domain-containing protein [Actinobacteria bacterium]|nr:PocR ligand-binding domain-containing protein [Actinomycetota bacterium]